MRTPQELRDIAKQLRIEFVEASKQPETYSRLRELQCLNDAIIAVDDAAMWRTDRELKAQGK